MESSDGRDNRQSAVECFARLALPTLVVDPLSGRVLAANPAARDLPRALRDYALSAPPGRSACLADQLLDGSDADGWEVSCETAAGNRQFLVYRSRLPAGAGASLAALTFVDVTHLRAAESARRREVEARDEFFSIAAHELKDPLASLQLALRLTLEMAADDRPPFEFVEYVEIARRQSERLAALLENLLDVSLIGSDRVHLDREAVDLADLAWEVTARLREVARQAGSLLAVEAPAPVIAYADRLKAEQVFTNLISNAVKYGNGRPISVRVRAESGDAVIEVEDAGRGIPAVDQHRIFDRFEKASEDGDADSLGLGLFIVKTYAEAHGGTVGVRSEPDGGSLFTVRLPLHRLARNGDLPSREPAIGQTLEGRP